MFHYFIGNIEKMDDLDLIVCIHHECNTDE